MAGGGECPVSVMGRCRGQQVAGLGLVFLPCELAETRQLLSWHFLEVPLSHLGSGARLPAGVSAIVLPCLQSRRSAWRNANIGEGEPGSGQHQAAPGFPRFLAIRCCFITRPLGAYFIDTKVSYEHGLKERRVFYSNQQTEPGFIS